MCLQDKYLTGMTLQCKPHYYYYACILQYTFSITLHTKVYLQHNKYKTLYMYKYVCAKLTFSSLIPRLHTVTVASLQTPPTQRKQ